MKNQLEINIRKSMEPTWKELLIPIYGGLNYIKRIRREIKSLSEENNGIIEGVKNYVKDINGNYQFFKQWK